EGMRPVHHQPGVNRLLAGFFGIQRRHAPAHRHGRRAATVRDRTHASRGWVDVESASHLERLHERAQADLVSSFHYQEHRVLGLHDGFALNLQSELPDVWAAQVVEKAGTHERILSRTALGCMLMPHNEKSHSELLDARSAVTSVLSDAHCSAVNDDLVTLFQVAIRALRCRPARGVEAMVRPRSTTD